MTGSPGDKVDDQYYPWVISHVPMFHITIITQPLGINGLFDGYYKVL